MLVKFKLNYMPMLCKLDSKIDPKFRFESNGIRFSLPEQQQEKQLGATGYRLFRGQSRFCKANNLRREVSYANFDTSYESASRHLSLAARIV